LAGQQRSIGHAARSQLRRARHDRSKRRASEATVRATSGRQRGDNQPASAACARPTSSHSRSTSTSFKRGRPRQTFTVHTSILRTDTAHLGGHRLVPARGP
jgi:hypothetical protein